MTKRHRPKKAVCKLRGCCKEFITVTPNNKFCCKEHQYRDERIRRTASFRERYRILREAGLSSALANVASSTEKSMAIALASLRNDS